MDELENLITSVVDHNLWDLHVATPAKVVQIDYDKQKVSVQPLIKERNRDADNNPKGLSSLPIINSVPVIGFTAGTGMLSFPIKVGDTGTLLFIDRSMDVFKFGDGVDPIDPKDMRKHNLNDAVFIMGLSPYSKALGFHAEDTVLRMNANTSSECKISFKPSGDIVIDTPTKLIANATGNVEVNTQADAKINVSGTTTVTSSGLVKIDASNTKITGQLRVDGAISSGGDVSTDAGFHANTHKHLGNLGKPTSPFI